MITKETVTPKEKVDVDTSPKSDSNSSKWTEVARREVKNATATQQQDEVKQAEKQEEKTERKEQQKRNAVVEEGRRRPRIKPNRNPFQFRQPK